MPCKATSSISGWPGNGCRLTKPHSTWPKRSTSRSTRTEERNPSVQSLGSRVEPPRRSAKRSASSRRRHLTFTVASCGSAALAPLLCCANLAVQVGGFLGSSYLTHTRLSDCQRIQPDAVVAAWPPQLAVGPPCRLRHPISLLDATANANRTAAGVNLEAMAGSLKPPRTELAGAVGTEQPCAETQCERGFDCEDCRKCTERYNHST